MTNRLGLELYNSKHTENTYNFLVLERNAKQDKSLCTHLFMRKPSSIPIIATTSTKTNEKPPCCLLMSRLRRSNSCRSLLFSSTAEFFSSISFEIKANGYKDINKPCQGSIYHWHLGHLLRPQSLC